MSGAARGVEGGAEGPGQGDAPEARRGEEGRRRGEGHRGEGDADKDMRYGVVSALRILHLFGHNLV